MNNALAQVERLWANLMALGPKRLGALAAIGLIVFAATGAVGYYLSRPTMETLYSGLDRDDVVSIGSTLQEAGIAFDVTADGATVMVPVGQASLARMTLAEKGLPHSGSVGNELYDKLGSLGLTSFMQEVTRVRALEGELARTIQMMHGVKAARVHIVMADAGSFRRERQPPSASVIVRTDGGDDRMVGEAIRHLVASAIPDMKVDEVTVLNVDGRLLASGSDSMEKSPDNLLGLEKEVTQDLRQKITMTLAPYLSLQNFQVSVAARLNADKTQTNETIYNPDQRVERSVRITKERQNSQNADGTPPTGVNANLPKTNNQPTSTKQSTDATDKREELTNYEISSKQVTTTSAGYTIQGLSVAVLVNRSALLRALGDKATPDAMDKQLKDIEGLVSTAAGLQKDRGDTVKVAVVDFVDADRDLAPVEAPSFMELALRQSGSYVTAGAVVLAAVLLIWFGLRPATKALLSLPSEQTQEALEALPGLGEMATALPALDGTPGGEHNFLIEAKDERDEFLESLLARKDKSPQRHLQKLVEFDEDVAAAILKQWIRQGAST
ncbi:MAG TPA: flagellar basal-body MS-ring/collar protein FliF [Roseiarcus sp.]|jgi:flagellar M-ring protein FliF